MYIFSFSFSLKGALRDGAVATGLCVCVCARARAGGGDNNKKEKRENVRTFICVCVCARARAHTTSQTSRAGHRLPARERGAPLLLPPPRPPPCCRRWHRGGGGGAAAHESGDAEAPDRRVLAQPPRPVARGAHEAAHAALALLVEGLRLDAQVPVTQAALVVAQVARVQPAAGAWHRAAARVEHDVRGQVLSVGDEVVLRGRRRRRRRRRRFRRRCVFAPAQALALGLGLAPALLISLAVSLGFVGHVYERAGCAVAHCAVTLAAHIDLLDAPQCLVALLPEAVPHHTELHLVKGLAGQLAGRVPCDDGKPWRLFLLLLLLLLLLLHISVSLVVSRRGVCVWCVGG